MTDKIEMWNKRSAIESMNRWFDGNNRHPLVICGARQVGKTWLAKDFARREYPKSTVMVDLMRDKTLCSKIDSSDLSPKILIDIISAFINSTFILYISFSLKFI